MPQYRRAGGPASAAGPPYPAAMLALLLWTLLAGAAIPAGALLASAERFRPRWLENELRRTIIALGGGALLSAVALVLVPDGADAVAAWWAPMALVAGGLAFMGLDIVLARRSGAGSQVAAMLADFVPEAIAMGATFVADRRTGVFLAVLIALQNLPEGFNAYRELRSADARSPAAHRTPRALLAMFALTALLGPACGLLGFWLLEPGGAVLGTMMLFAAGGILYLTFEDIAPQARLDRAFAPPMGAVIGFALGLIGHVLIA